MPSFFYYYKQPYAPQNGQPRINEQIPKNIQSSKMEPEGSRKQEQTNSNKIESVTYKKKETPTSKSLGPDGFAGEFSQTFREELTPILLKLLQIIAEEGKLPNSFYKVSITMISKSDKENMKITGQYHLWIQMQKFSTKYQQTESNSIPKRIIHHDQVTLIHPRNSRVVQYLQVNQWDTVC